jgi:hypothetical protein
VANSNSNPPSVYCIDTSSLVNLREWRPPRNYPEPWRRLEGLIRADRLIAPTLVLSELKEVDDALLRWARKWTKMFKRNSRSLVERVQQILREMPDLVDVNQMTESADPFVVALALNESSGLYDEMVTVVTDEKYAPGRSRIPHACEKYGLRYLTLHQMFLFEGWTF